MNEKLLDECVEISKKYDYYETCLINGEFNFNKFRESTSWEFVSYRCDLSMDFIRKFQLKVHWFNISAFQYLSEDFLREFQNKVGWDEISYSQKLSLEFISEFNDKLDWVYISAHMEMPEEFIIMVLPGNNRTKLILELFYNKEVTFETHAEVIKDILISNENNAGVYRPADNMM